MFDLAQVCARRRRRRRALVHGRRHAGRDHDLVRDRQVAEFKFIEWRGGGVDQTEHLVRRLFNLASAKTDKRRVMYVVSNAEPLRFSGTGERSRAC
jgi:hypothetical protein